MKQEDEWNTAAEGRQRRKAVTGRVSVALRGERLMLFFFGGIAFAARCRLVEDQGQQEVQAEHPEQDGIKGDHGQVHNHTQFAGSWKVVSKWQESSEDMYHPYAVMPAPGR